MTELNSALVALLQAQKEIGKVSKNKENPFHHSKYADYEAVLDTVKGPLNKNGFVIVHQGIYAEGKDYLKTTLIHTSGGEFSSQFPLSIDPNPQKTGSLITYLKRYNLASLTGLASEDDDDGNAASQTPAKTASRRAEPAKNEAMAAPALIAKGKILDVNIKFVGEGKSQLKKYVVAMEGGYIFNTLNRTFGDIAISAKNNKWTMIAGYKNTQYGMEIVSFDQDKSAEAVVDDDVAEFA